MPIVERSALVLHPAARMFRLVEDVARYPEFLSWCEAAEVLSRDETRQEAGMTIAIAGIRKSFRTRNRLRFAEAVEMRLVEGPFTRLQGLWQFTALSEEGCRIALKLDFEFSHSLLSAAFEKGFSRVVDRLVSDFVNRADELYA